MANINYWGAIDEYLQSSDSPAAHQHSNPFKLNQSEIFYEKTNTQITRKSGRSKPSLTAGDNSNEDTALKFKIAERK